MIAKSHIFSEMVNSVAGIVYFYNRFASICGRARVHPVDINSVWLETQRSLFSASVSGWKTLTQPERDAWELYAKSTPWVGGLGDTVYLTGQQMYIAFRSGFLSAQPGGNFHDFDAAPCTPGLFPMPWVQYECCEDSDIGVRVNISNNHLTDNMDFITRISPPQSKGKKYYKGPWDTANAVVSGNQAPDTHIYTDFCPLCPGRFFFQIRGWQTNAPHVPCTMQYGTLIACNVPIAGESAGKTRKSATKPKPEPVPA